MHAKSITNPPSRFVSVSRKSTSFGMVETLERRVLLSAGKFDPTFGTGGVAYALPTGGSSALALLPDGKIVTAGTTSATGESFLLSQFNANGTVDRTFGQNGEVVTHLGVGNSEGFVAIVVQRDGKIVVDGGEFNAAAPSIIDVVMRYLPDGKLDPTFGKGGVFTFPPTLGGAATIILQNDGKILLAGSVLSADPSTNPDSHSEFALARLTTSGKLDSTFGKGGEVLTDFGSVHPFSGSGAESLAVQKDGRIIAGGFTDAVSGSFFNLAIARYNTDGTLDPTFGVGGKQVLEGFIEPTDKSFKIAVQANGKILVPGGYNGLVARLTPTGKLDPSFGKGGFVAPSSSTYASVFQVFIQKGGDAVVVGNNGGGYSLLLARLKPDGTLDKTFGAAGAVRTPGVIPFDAILQPNGDVVVLSFELYRYTLSGRLDGTFGYHGRSVDANGIDGTINAIAVQKDGKILVAGNELSPDPAFAPTDAAIARYNPNGTLDTSFGVDGHFFVHIGNVAQFNALLVEPDGTIVAGGTGDVGATPQFLLVRLNPDGSYDHSFDGTGVATLDFTGHKQQAIASLAQGPGDTIVAAGSVDNSFAVARFLPDGQLDPSFANRGREAIKPEGLPSHLVGLLVHPDGRMILAGDIGADFGLIRILPNGTYDQTFGTGGLVTTHFVNSFNVSAPIQATSLAEDASGNIVLAGNFSFSQPSGPPTYYGFALARYRFDGKLDPTFGSGGKLDSYNSNLSYPISLIGAIAIQPDGKIVAGSLTGYPAAVVRFNDTEEDPTFGDAGATLLTPADSMIVYPPVNAVAIEPDGKILAALYSDLYRLTGK